MGKGKQGLYHKPIFSSKTFSEQRQNTERKTEWVDGRRNWMSEEEPARFQFVSGSGHLFVFLLAPGKLSITTNTEFLQIFFYSSNDQLTKCKTCLHKTRHKRPRVNDRRWYCNTLFTKNLTSLVDGWSIHHCQDKIYWRCVGKVKQEMYSWVLATFWTDSFTERREDSKVQSKFLFVSKM